MSNKFDNFFYHPQWDQNQFDKEGFRQHIETLAKKDENKSYLFNNHGLAIAGLIMQIWQKGKGILGFSDQTNVIKVNYQFLKLLRYGAAHNFHQDTAIKPAMEKLLRVVSEDRRYEIVRDNLKKLIDNESHPEAMLDREISVYHKFNKDKLCSSFWTKIFHLFHSPLNAHNFVFYRNIGKIHLSEERYDDAISSLRDAYRIDPSSVEVKLLLAQAYQKSFLKDVAAGSEDWDKYLPALETLKTIDPKFLGQKDYETFLQLKNQSLIIEISIHLKRGDIVQAYNIGKEVNLLINDFLNHRNSQDFFYTHKTLAPTQLELGKLYIHATNQEQFLVTRRSYFNEAIGNLKAHVLDEDTTYQMVMAYKELSEGYFSEGDLQNYEEHMDGLVLLLKNTPAHITGKLVIEVSYDVGVRGVKELVIEGYEKLAKVYYENGKIAGAVRVYTKLRDFSKDLKYDEMLAMVRNGKNPTSPKPVATPIVPRPVVTTRTTDGDTYVDIDNVDTDDLEQLFMDGRRSLSQGKYEEAYKKFEQAAQKAEDPYHYEQEMIRCCQEAIQSVLSKNRAKDTLTWHIRLTRLLPNEQISETIRAMIHLGHSYATMDPDFTYKVYNSVVDYMAKTYVDVTDQLRIYEFLGERELRAFQYEKALTYLEKSIGIKKYDEKLLSQIITCCQKLNDLDKEEFYRGLLMERIPSEQAARELALVYEKKGDYDRALDAYHRAQSFNRNPMAYQGRFVALHKKAGDQAYLKGACSPEATQKSINEMIAFIRDSDFQREIQTALNTRRLFVFGSDEYAQLLSLQQKPSTIVKCIQNGDRLIQLIEKAYDGNDSHLPMDRMPPAIRERLEFLKAQMGAITVHYGEMQSKLTNVIDLIKSSSARQEIEKALSGWFSSEYKELVQLGAGFADFDDIKRQTLKALQLLSKAYDGKKDHLRLESMPKELRDGFEDLRNLMSSKNSHISTTILHYQRAFALAPNEFGLYLNRLVDQHYRDKDYKNAIGLINFLKGKFPNEKISTHTKVYIVEAKNLIQEGKIQEALALLNEPSIMKSKYKEEVVDIYFQLAQHYHANPAAYPDALDCYFKALDVQGKDRADISESLEQLYKDIASNGDYEKILPVAKKLYATSEQPYLKEKLSSACFTLANDCFNKTHNVNIAIDYCEIALDGNSVKAASYWLLADLYSERYKTTQKLLAAARDDAAKRFCDGKLQSYLKDIISFRKKAVELDPTNIGYLYELGRLIYFETADAGEHLYYFRKAQALADKNQNLNSPDIRDPRAKGYRPIDARPFWGEWASRRLSGITENEEMGKLRLRFHTGRYCPYDIFNVEKDWYSPLKLQPHEIGNTSPQEVETTLEKDFKLHFARYFPMPPVTMPTFAPGTPLYPRTEPSAPPAWFAI